MIDLHAMRATLGTNLAKAGVVPQIAQQIMRHSDYRTTLSHYTVLGIADTAKAIEQLPTIKSSQREAATGTLDSNPQLNPQQLGHAAAQTGVKQRDGRGSKGMGADRRNSNKAQEKAGRCDLAQRSAAKAGDRIRTDDVQLGKLTFYH